MRKLHLKKIKGVVIKVGTSVLTRGGRFDRKIIADLASQISGFLRRGMRVSIVSSGAIGAGMSLMKLKSRPTEMQGLQAAAAVGQRYLMQCWEEAFSKNGFSTAQVLLTWDDLADRKRCLNAKRTLEQIQRWKHVPVINENDTVATDEIRFGDNDRLSALLAILGEADALVILSDTDGLYATNGSNGALSGRIRVVEKMDERVFAHVRDRRKQFTVGGMRTKLDSVRVCVNAGIPVFLADGRKRQVLKRLFQGENLGTFFLPSKSRGKNWLAHFREHVKR